MNRSHSAAAFCLSLAALLSCTRSNQSAEKEGATPAASAAKAEACQLVTLEDVKAIYGPDMAVEPRRSNTTSGPAADLSMCLYASTGDAIKAVSVTARVSKIGPDSLGNLEKFVQSTKEQLGDSVQYEKVEGVGAPTVWQSLGGTGGTAFAFFGTAHIGINADSAGDRSAKEVSLDLLKKAVQRYGSGG